MKCWRLDRKGRLSHYSLWEVSIKKLWEKHTSMEKSRLENVCNELDNKNDDRRKWKIKIFSKKLSWYSWNRNNILNSTSNLGVKYIFQSSTRHIYLLKV